MKKKELLAMKKLRATPEMLRVARENPTVTKKVKLSWGMTRKEETCTYGRYIRAAVENGILKVAVFVQRELESGLIEPQFEVYCDKKADQWNAYDTRTKQWRTAKIDNLPYLGLSCVYGYSHWQTDADRKKVNEYFETGENKDIFAAVLDFQNGIRDNLRQKKYRSEIEQIDEVMREVPDVPKSFKDWIVKNCFRETLFYEPESMCHHRWPKMYCTHCRQWMDVPTDYKDKPEHNKETKCPRCGAKATYKSWNKQKYVEDSTDVGILQRLKDDSGWILRNFSCKIKRNHEKGWEEYELHTFEDVRVRLDDTFREREYFEWGEYKYTGVIRWCHEVRRGGFYGYYSQNFGRVVMYTANLKRELKREPFAKMDLKKIMKGGERVRVDPVFTLMKLKQHPSIEYLQKSGMHRMINEIMRGQEEMELFARGQSRLNEVLQIDKQRFRRIKELDGGCRTLRALQYEERTGNRITDDNLRFLEEQEASVRELIGLVERTGMNLQRMVNYLKKQMEITGQNWHELLRHYEDYLDMAELFGMDVTDEIVCRQPQMTEYHNRYTERKNRQKNRIRDREVDLKYKNIRNNVKKYEERFKFQTKDLKIVVPHKASDITREGRKQHHCVGASDVYISNMDKEKYFILFLRRCADPTKPYYTLEVTWDGEIRQFYAAYDRQPDKEKIEKVLEKFTDTVRKREEEIKKKMHKAEIRDDTEATRIETTWYMTPKQEAM